MNKKLFISLAPLLAIAAFAVMPVVAQAETKTLVSSAINSLCVLKPTDPGFEPTIGGRPNYLPLTTPSNTGKPFPDTGAACETGFPTTAVAMVGPGGPGEKAAPYNGSIAKASWVSIAANGSDGSNPPPKYYIYDEKINLCENQVASATIAVHMFADNTASAFLNGVPIGGLAFHSLSNRENFDGPPVGGWAFGPNVGVLAGFTSGENTLQFVVLDETELSTGLDFSATITAPRCKEIKEPPEFPGLGRCVKVSRGAGSYKDSGCETAEVEEGGNYEWLPGAAKNKFTSAEGKSVLEVESEGGKAKRLKLTCISDTDSGEYIGESEDLETIVFTGCTSEGLKCTSKGEPAGTVSTTLLRSLYGFIARPKDVGVSLQPASGGSFAEFECGGLPVVIRGSVIAPTTPISKMTTKFTEKFKGTLGKQIPEKFESEPKDVLEISFAGEPFKQVALTSTDVITNEEPLEIREAP